MPGIESSVRRSGDLSWSVGTRLDSLSPISTMPKNATTVTNANSRFRLIPSVSRPEQDGLKRLEQDHQIEEGRHLLDVVQVVLQLGVRIIDTRPIAVVHLRPSGQSGFGGEAKG